MKFQEDYYLFQNFPNPFNPSTTISWHQSIESKVTITIYDVLGNEIETIVDQIMETGTHFKSFTAEHLPSGIYFYRIVVNKFVQTNKMFLLK